MSAADENAQPPKVSNKPANERHASWCRYTVMGHVGWTCAAWDPVTFVRLHPKDGPLDDLTPKILESSSDDDQALRERIAAVLYTVDSGCDWGGLREDDEDRAFYLNSADAVLDALGEEAICHVCGGTGEAARSGGKEQAQ